MPSKGYDWRSAFLEALRQVPVVSVACEAAGVTRNAAYAARKVDKDFGSAWDDAIETGVDKLDAEAMRRASVGFEEPVIWQGKPMKVRDPVTKKLVPLTVRRHSDALLMFVLKGRRKQVYAERTELTGADGKPVALDHTTKAARLSALIEAGKARRAKAKGETEEGA